MTSQDGLEPYPGLGGFRTALGRLDGFHLKRVVLYVKKFAGPRIIALIIEFPSLVAREPRQRMVRVYSIPTEYPIPRER